MAVTLSHYAIPSRKRWSREEYRRLGSSGFLSGHFELIDGEILEKMPKGPAHCIALRLLAHWLESVFGRLFVQTQDPIVLPVPDLESTEPEPDIAVTRAPITSYVSDNPHAADIVLVCEVSDSSPLYDRGRKADIYAASGIAEYWVVDIGCRCIIVHRGPSLAGYHDVVVIGEDQTVSPLEHPHASTPVAALLPPIFGA